MQENAVKAEASTYDGVDALRGGCPSLFGFRSKSGSQFSSQEIHQHDESIL